MTTWDERFRTGQYPQEPEPSPMLRAYAKPDDDARALDIATGTGRNAVFLAEQGYDVDALDQSEEGLRITRERAAESGVDDRLSLVQADAKAYDYPVEAYDLVTISFFRTQDRLNDIKAALKPGGVLFYQHHLRSPEATVGPSDDRYRFRANELLHACLDLTVLGYEAATDVEGAERVSVTATIVARNSHGGTQSYPTRR
jgi:ubiquinone/menaquinone biosynthesis C-methylase UbiE